MISFGIECRADFEFSSKMELGDVQSRNVNNRWDILAQVVIFCVADHAYDLCFRYCLLLMKILPNGILSSEIAAGQALVDYRDSVVVPKLLIPDIASVQGCSGKRRVFASPFVPARYPANNNCFMMENRGDAPIP